ncbi:2-methylpropanoate--CoA ligase CCL4-like isoform X2 [Nymphaea colorata]|nr:2-methylpropanoate--CoA ligase CCL4-like isoform X2 [Nymphaea colorata]
MDQLKPSLPNSPPLTPLTFLERAALVYGECTSIVYNGTSFTWSQTLERCLRLASSLSSLGIGRGDVVSVISPNIPAMYEMHFAVPMSGAIFNSINARLDARTISVILLHSESKLVIVDYQFLPVVNEALALVSAKTKSAPKMVLIKEDDSEDDDDLRPRASGSRPEIMATYEDLVKKGDPKFKWVWPLSEWTPMVLNYTSGTTSDPKGVVHCHRGLFIMSLNSLIDWGVTGQPVYLWTLPMFHANGWSFPWGMAALGGTNVCLRRFDPGTIFSAIAEHKVTHMCGAPVVLNMISNGAKSAQLPHPVQILTAGAPPPAAVLFRTEALGFSVSHGYGLTETGGLVVSCAWKQKWNRLPASDRARLKARQGVRALGMVEMDVVDKDTLKSVPRDGTTLGEIVLRGGCIMLGYLKNPEATAMSMRDGWFFTGDVGVMHPDGYLEIKDRSKDIIISGGENVSSVEVESILYTHPAINEAAIVARPDEYWGETPCAFLSLKPEHEGQITEADIISFCRQKLPHYMVPKTVLFEELPKTSTGKIQKFILRRKAKALGSPRVSIASRI